MPTMADENAKPPTLQELLWGLASYFFKREATMVAAAVLLLLVLGGSTVIWAQSQQRTTAVEAIEPLERRVKDLEDGGRRHAQEEAAAMAEMKRDVGELARDVRELYRVVRDPTRRSERLEQPVDGGQ